MRSDDDIAQTVKLKKIAEIIEKLGIAEHAIEPYGHSKAKISLDYLNALSESRNGKLILVTAMTPTPSGEGKTTTTIGLGDALNRIGKKAMICLREPSLGPVFGIKGGATGGGYSQVVPREAINLHFTGDFHAIQSANNLLAALIDNHIYHDNTLEFDLRRIVWKRAMDMNDRALRNIMVGMGGVGNGFPRQDGFDLVVASEVMAIFCLAQSLDDLKERLGKCVIGYTRNHRPITAKDLNAHGAMAVLLKDALNPNVVQTLEHTPAFVHGGPFANIAHGCNSMIATKSALKLADYVVTEAGFGADLGAEKFVDILCRKSGLRPDVAVVVASIRALKYHGEVDSHLYPQEDFEALSQGMANLERHVSNIQQHYGLPCVVAVNHFTTDTHAEFAWVENRMKQLKTPVVLCTHWAHGGEGALELARVVVSLAEAKQNTFKFVYEDHESIWNKAKLIATQIYGASDIQADSSVKVEIEKLEKAGYGHLPVCIAKTQYSFSTDPKRRGAPVGHVLDIREVRLCAGAEFIVLICGQVMTMPGLPKKPCLQL